MAYNFDINSIDKHNVLKSGRWSCSERSFNAIERFVLPAMNHLQTQVSTTSRVYLDAEEEVHGHQMGILAGQSRDWSLFDGSIPAHQLQVAFRNTVEPTCAPSYRESGSNAATQVFSITELLELVLDFADVPELVSVWGVCRTAKEIVEASSRSRKKLPLQQSYVFGELRYPFVSCMSMMSSHFRCFPHRVSPLCGTIATFYVGNDGRLPRIGTGYRQMFISQPPPPWIYIYVSRCPPPSDPRGPSLALPLALRCQAIGKISADEGLRIGDLYHVAHKAIEQFESLDLLHGNAEMLKCQPGDGWQLCFEWVQTRWRP